MNTAFYFGRGGYEVMGWIASMRFAFPGQHHAEYMSEEIAVLSSCKINGSVFLLKV